MFADLHAVVILGTLIVPLIVVAANPACRPRPWQEVVAAIAPIAVVGVIFLLGLSVTGVPIAEWLFPMIGVTIAGVLVKSNRTFQAIRWVLFVLAVGLGINGWALRSDSYVSSSAQRFYQGAERNRLVVIRNKLEQTYPGNKELPAQPVAQILAEQEDLTTWNRKKLHSVWHTAFTGLYRVTETAGEAWYPGGPVAIGAGKVEWKPKTPPPDA